MNGVSSEKIIDISIYVSTYMKHAAISKEMGFPCPDRNNAELYDLKEIAFTESMANGAVESFGCNWLAFIESISKNENYSKMHRVFVLESIANDASSLVGLT